MKDKLTGADEDLIFKNKKFIEELSNVQNLYFETLCEDLELNEIGNDYMFDYIFNDHNGIGFDEYIEKYGFKGQDIFEDNDHDSCESILDNCN